MNKPKKASSKKSPAKPKAKQVSEKSGKSNAKSEPPLPSPTNQPDQTTKTARRSNAQQQPPKSVQNVVSQSTTPIEIMTATNQSKSLLLSNNLPKKAEVSPQPTQIQPEVEEVVVTSEDNAGLSKEDNEINEALQAIVQNRVSSPTIKTGIVYILFLCFSFSLRVPIMNRLTLRQRPGEDLVPHAGQIPDHAILEPPADQADPRATQHTHQANEPSGRPATSPDAGLATETVAGRPEAGPRNVREPPGQAESPHQRPAADHPEHHTAAAAEHQERDVAARLAQPERRPGRPGVPRGAGGGEAGDGGPDQGRPDGRPAAADLPDHQAEDDAGGGRHPGQSAAGDTEAEGRRSGAGAEAGRWRDAEIDHRYVRLG